HRPPRPVRLSFMRPAFTRPARLALLAGLAVFSAPPASAQVTLTGPYVTYAQNFNTLPNTGTTGSALPAGWLFTETGSTADTTYGISDGSSSTANTYSFGSTGSTDRALGALGSTGSGGLNTTVGASFVNNAGMPPPG